MDLRAERPWLRDEYAGGDRSNGKSVGGPSCCASFQALTGSSLFLYMKTTSSPATEPVFLTVTDAETVALGSSASSVSVLMLGCETEKVVYDKPYPNGPAPTRFIVRHHGHDG